MGNLVKPILKGLAARSGDKVYNKNLIDGFLPKVFMGTKYTGSNSFKKMMSNAHISQYPQMLKEIQVSQRKDQVTDFNPLNMQLMTGLYQKYQQ